MFETQGGTRGIEPKTFRRRGQLLSRPPTAGPMCTGKTCCMQCDPWQQNRPKHSKATAAAWRGCSHTGNLVAQKVSKAVSRQRAWCATKPTGMKQAVCSSGVCVDVVRGG